MRPKIAGSVALLWLAACGNAETTTDISQSEKPATSPLDAGNPDGYGTGNRFTAAVVEISNNDRRGETAAPAQVSNTGGQLREALIGSWASVEFGCENDRTMHFAADGRVGMGDYQGYWRVDGSQLHMRFTHSLGPVPLFSPKSETLTVTLKEPGRMTVEGPLEEIGRCPATQYEFAIPAQ